MIECYIQTFSIQQSILHNSISRNTKGILK